MMTSNILGLDIGGANLKAATSAGAAAAMPFPLWKQPEKLAAALAELIAGFSNVSRLAVTMTGELCDCFETKREGVNAILDAVEAVARQTPVSVWSTEGDFVTPSQARQAHMTVAASNWHALASLAGRWVPDGTALLIDIGSTTTDLIPVREGRPATRGRTDPTRMECSELVYAGVRRTPVMALFSPGEVAAEYFASMLDVFLVLGSTPEDSTDFDTADARAATRVHALSRLSRMLGGDREILPEGRILQLAQEAQQRLIQLLVRSIRGLGEDWNAVIVSGSGEFLAQHVLRVGGWRFQQTISISEKLGPNISACAPAYAVAVLAKEHRA